MNMEVTTSPVDNLIGGTFPQLTKAVILKTGKIYKRGEILELDAESKAISLATDSKAKFVLVNDTDATSSDVEALVFITGQFNLDECVLNQTLDKVTIAEALHLRSIFLK